jgi:formylglycine-generating enzyme
MKLLSFPFAIIALSTVALSVGCGKSGGDDTSTQTTDTGTQTIDTGTPIVDADNDGVAFDDDCDDNDATLGAVAEDADCDGTLTADDCDDGDNTSTIVSEDGDCDGWLTADDCDDGDNTSTIVSEDGDCDGTLTADDCDDGDSASTKVSEDGDCDGTLTADDCDDTDDTVWLCPITHPGGGVMLPIFAGTFDMGCTTAQQVDGRCDSDESPVHSVTLTHDFYMGETEVTQGEYESVMGTNPSSFSTCVECPVEQVSWHDVAEYANALSVADGLTECFSCLDGECSTPDSPYTCDGYRLPTEAEWEYAARAGTDYIYAGSNTLEDVGWYYWNSSSQTHPVAQKAPNDWGLYDMSGNVYEWVWEWYDSSYYSSSPSSDPEGPTSGSKRVIRGGGWPALDDSYIRVSIRARTHPEWRSWQGGFRLSRTANP